MWLTETGGSLPLSHNFNVRPGTCRVYQSNAGLGFSLSWFLVLVVEVSFGLLSQHVLWTFFGQNFTSDSVLSQS